MRPLLFATAALAALSALPVRAETPVDEVVVTATRLPSPPDVITGAHVIDRAEIEARGVTFASDLLSTIPGVGVARTGAFGGVTAIRIRGASPDKTLVLIDGVPVDDPSDPNGTYDAALLQTTDLERIEVLSGPQSSLWGSDAIGGVISFTTRELDGLRAEAEGGSFKTARGFVGAGRVTDRYALSADIAGFRTDGISKADTGTEKDGFKTATANLAGRLALTDAIKLDGRLRWSYADADTDGYPPPNFTLADTPDRYKTRSWQGVARATADALGFTHQVSVNAYDIHRTSASSFPASFDADRQVYRWTASKGDALVLGAERQRTSADLSSGASLNLSNTAVFAVGRLKLDRLTFTGSARYDDPDKYASKATGRVAAAMDLGRGFTAVASAGTGFKTPTISEAVCDFCFAPPVPLRPERATGYDFKLAWANERIHATVTAYRLSVRDQIAYSALRYVNIARTRSEGLDAELDALLTNELRLKLAYGYLDAIDRSTGASLLRVPDHSGSAALFWTHGPWEAAVTVRGESSQSDVARDGFSKVRRPGFATADVSGAYAVTPKLSLTARVENVTDKRFEETYGFKEPGVAAYVGIRVRN